jgi:hypothetical protein
MRNPLHSICPYFAMFPEEFVRDHLERYTKRGDLVFDCFSGRGTTLLESLLNGRDAAAMDINPVAFCISGAKAEVPDYDQLNHRLDDLEYFFQRTSRSALSAERRDLPAFFGRAFHSQTLEQLLFLRRALRWRTSRVDRFAAALVLGSLHGEMNASHSYFSNQMPRSISTKPAYSLKYWSNHKLWPRRRNVFEILRGRAELRFSGPHPDRDGRVALADARKAGRIFKALTGTVDAVITSPPYFDVTNFEEDQWLRLWFLGHLPQPTYRTISKDDRYDGAPVHYWAFLTEVWKGLRPLLKRSAIIVCRLGAKGLSQSLMTRRLGESIRTAFPRAALAASPVRTDMRNRQRDRFQPGTEGCSFEVDYVFSISG